MHVVMHEILDRQSLIRSRVQIIRIVREEPIQLLQPPIALRIKQRA